MLASRSGATISRAPIRPARVPASIHADALRKNPLVVACAFCGDGAGFICVEVMVDWAIPGSRHHVHVGATGRLPLRYSVLFIQAFLNTDVHSLLEDCVIICDVISRESEKSFTIMK